MQHSRTKTYKVLHHIARGPFRQILQVCDRGMSIDNQQTQHASQTQEWHRSLEAVLSERKSIDAFRLWLRIQRKDDALDLYLAIIAFRRHARRDDQRASSVAFGICRRYISPRTGLSDFLPIQMRNDLTNKISNLRNTGHKPDLQLFDHVAPLVWAYLCEQHALFVCSKEFSTVVKSAEQGNMQLKMSELNAARNATANDRVPPLIGFGKYRVRESAGFSSHRHSRPRSEPPGRRNRNLTEYGGQKEGDDQNASEHSLPIIRHDRPEDREMFFQLICDRLAALNGNDEVTTKQSRQQIKTDVERETDLTNDNDNERRLIQRDFNYIDDEYELPWDEENLAHPEVYDWSVNESARLASVRGAPMLFDQKHQQTNSFMHKSASIGFSDIDRNTVVDPVFAYNAPFLKNQLYAVHKHLVAPLSNKYAYHHVSRDRFQVPPPPAPQNRNAQPLHNNGTYQQFSDSSGFCSSESANFQFYDREPRRKYWMGSLPRDNSFPFEARQCTNMPNIRSSSRHDHLTVTYKDDVTGIPVVIKLSPRPLTFREFRNCFGIKANSNKRFLFKSECEDASAPYQWTVINDDMTLLPVFDSKIIAECRSFTDN